MASQAPSIGGAILGAGLGILGGFLQERSARKARRRQRRGINIAQAFANKRVEEIASGPLFSAATNFLTSTFQDAQGSPLAQDAAKRIRQAQAVRGTFAGNLGAVQEGVGTSAFAQRLRQSLLPQALAFAQAPELLRQQIQAAEVPLQVAAATGGQIAGVGAPNLISPLVAGLSQGISGAAAGFNLGSQFQQNQRLDSLIAGRQTTAQPLPFDRGLAGQTNLDVILQQLRRS